MAVFFVFCTWSGSLTGTDKTLDTLCGESRRVSGAMASSEPTPDSVDLPVPGSVSTPEVTTMTVESGGRWPMALGDLGRANSTMDPGRGEIIELRWVRRIGDYGNTSLYAYDRFTGEPLWHVELSPSSQHTGIDCKPLEECWYAFWSRHNCICIISQAPRCRAGS